MSKKDKLTLVALDDGSGNIAFSFIDGDEQKEGYEPSTVSKGLKFKANGTEIDSIWSTNGKEYSVTNDDSHENTCSYEYQTSDINRVLVNNTLANAGLSGKELHIGCTIPTEQFYKKSNGGFIINDELVDAKIASLQMQCVNLKDETKSPVIKKVNVYPEAVPALFHVAMNDDGDLDSDIVNSKNIVVIDIGHFTADLALLNSQPNYELKNAITIKSGAFSLQKTVRQQLSLKYRDIGFSSDPIEFSDSAIAKYITDKQARVLKVENGKRVQAMVDISEIINSAIDSYITNLYSEFESLVDGKVDTVDHCIVVGGGTYWLKEAIEASFPMVKTANDGQHEMAIVRGVHLLLRSDFED